MRNNWASKGYSSFFQCLLSVASTRNFCSGEHKVPYISVFQGYFYIMSIYQNSVFWNSLYSCYIVCLKSFWCLCVKIYSPMLYHLKDYDKNIFKFIITWEKKQYWDHYLNHFFYFLWHLPRNTDLFSSVFVTHYFLRMGTWYSRGSSCLGWRMG